VLRHGNVGNHVQFDDETWQAIQAVARQTGKSFQELASAAMPTCSRSTISLSASKQR
jgi:hypothetical protein